MKSRRVAVRGIIEAVDLSKTTHGSIEIAEIDFIDPPTTILLPHFLTQQNLVEDAKLGITKYFNNLTETT